MDINKAIRKQEKSNIRFLFFLGFIFFILPLILFLSNKMDLFFIAYLAVIEFLILTTILISINNTYLKYSCDSYRIKIKLNRLSEELNIVCNKVVLIHTEGINQQMNIVMLMNSKFRNKKIRTIDEGYLKQHPYFAQSYYKIKKHNPEDSYYYLELNKGGYEKYRLLDVIYRNCVNAQYTEEAVERIKEYRKI